MTRRLNRNKVDLEHGPKFVGNSVRWGSVSVSRASYDSARALIAGEPEASDPEDRAGDEHGVACGDSCGQCELVSNELEPSDLLLTVQLIEECAPIRNTKKVMPTIRTEPMETMTPQEVAREAPAHINTVRIWIREGKLKAQKTRTGRLRILRTDFRKFMGFEK